MWKPLLMSCVMVFGFAGAASAHFGMVIPAADAVTDKKDAAVSVDVSFSHPMEMQGMPMAAPKVFKVVGNGRTEDLKPTLKAKKIMGHDAWNTTYTLKKPGVYQFIMEPEPYWEPAEDTYIIHYTKAYVAGFGEEEGWDAPAGLKTEIVPLTRPFGNYAGNVFQGQVLLDGKPVPGAEVEVEHYNKNKTYVAPNDYMVTQVVKADNNGVFTYGVPFAGWWGFAALNTAKEKMDYKGARKNVELGAVLWVNFLKPTPQK